MYRSSHNLDRVRHRRGNALVYATVCMTALVGFGALGMDMARVRTAKAELQSATDAAARYAATAMRSLDGNASAASANAAAVMAESKVDGLTPSFNPNTDLQLGIWIPATKTFTPASLGAGANAVRLSTSVTLGDSTRPLALAGMLGQHTTIRGTAIVMMNGTSGSSYVSAKGNPWLAGMPAGSVSNNWRPDASNVWDTAGGSPNAAMSPGVISLTGSSIAAGATIMFNNVTGTANNTGGGGGYTADGNTTWVVSLGDSTAGSGYVSKPMNGVSNVRAPINSMIAVFLSDSAPNTTAAPAALDFSTTAQRDYQTLSPLLKQAFFIGNGRRDNGEVQQIVVPAGATRLYIGNMDAWQWNDNSGGYDVTINSTTSISTVK